MSTVMGASADLMAAVWIAPESAEHLFPAGLPADLRPMGCYREALPDGELGGLLISVNDAPGNRVDGAAHFESFGGDPADYYPYWRPDGHVARVDDVIVFESAPGIVPARGAVPGTENL